MLVKKLAIHEGDQNGGLDTVDNLQKRNEDCDREAAEQAKILFAKYDLNGDGCIDEDELVAILSAMSSRFTKSDAVKLLKGADMDGNGRLDVGEFIEWVMAPAKSRGGRITAKMGAAPSLGRVVAEKTTSGTTYMRGLELLFNVYDKELTGTISPQQFLECHVILQAALRLADIDDGDEHDNDDLEYDREEASDFVATQAKSGLVGFLDFANWMKRHIPLVMSQDAFYDYCSQVAAILAASFEHGFSVEAGYVKEKECVMSHLKDKLSDSMQLIRKATKEGEIGSARQVSPWDNPPPELSIDRLKAAHMMVCPINMGVVEDISWEILCVPSGDAGSEIWVAELVRRVLQKTTCTMKSGKLAVQSPHYYMYDTAAKKWVISESSASVFLDVQPGLALYCLLRSASNFSKMIRWAQIQVAFEGGIDMRFISEDEVERFNEHILQLVLDQMQEDGIKSGDSREAQTRYAQRYLANELEIHTGMVMACLLKLQIVDSDPAWEAFVTDNMYA